jgi:RNA polymerase sigma-70 factor (ECF subfamily)
MGARKRDVRREVSMAGGPYPEASSEALAAQLLGKLTTPSQVAVLAEMKARLAQSLESMDPGDREIIALRHFEELAHAEAAHVLGIDESAASKRYLRAIKRLKEILDRIPGMSELV